MSKERRVSEPKKSRCGTFTFRTVKYGNKILGTIESRWSEEDSANAAVYWITAPEVGRLVDGGKTALFVRSKVSGLSAYGVKRVGLRMSDGTTFLTSLERVTQDIDTSVSIPLIECEVTLPTEDERAAYLFSKMRLAGGRTKSL